MPAQLLDHVLASHHRRWDKVVPTQHLLCTESATHQFALTLNLRALASFIPAAMCVDVDPPLRPSSHPNLTPQLSLSHARGPFVDGKQSWFELQCRHKAMLSVGGSYPRGAGRRPQPSFGWSPAVAVSLGFLGLQERLLD
jgi:hypothetical protein